MMDYNTMSGDGSGGMMLFAWLTYVLVTAALILAIAALWKYVNKK